MLSYFSLEFVLWFIKALTLINVEFLKNQASNYSNKVLQRAILEYPLPRYGCSVTWCDAKRYATLRYVTFSTDVTLCNVSLQCITYTTYVALLLFVTWLYAALFSLPYLYISRPFLCISFEGPQTMQTRVQRQREPVWWETKPCERWEFLQASAHLKKGKTHSYQTKR